MSEREVDMNKRTSNGILVAQRGYQLSSSVSSGGRGTTRWVSTRLSCASAALLWMTGQLAMWYVSKGSQLVCQICDRVLLTILIGFWQWKSSGGEAAYAFTDYCSQGQTILYVIVDIASPPTGTLSLFNLYIVLSRSAGRHLIRLLRDFDDRILKCEHDQQLIIEDDRLAGLNLETRNWYESEAW